MNRAVRKLLTALTDSRAIARAERAEADLAFVRREAAARLVEYQTAYDRFQSVVTTAQAEVEELRDRLGAAEQDLAAETARADAAEREAARLRQGQEAGA